MKKRLVWICILLLLCPLVLAITPQGDYDFRSYYRFFNLNFLNVTNNISTANLSVTNEVCILGDCRSAWPGVGETSGDVTKNISTINLTLTDWIGNWSDVYSNILSINNSVSGTGGDVTKNISTINLTLVDWTGNWSDVYSNILSINNSISGTSGDVTQNITTLNRTLVDIISNNLTSLGTLNQTFNANREQVTNATIQIEVTLLLT